MPDTPTTPTETPVQTPTRTPGESPSEMPSPDRFYQPERLCPDQSQQGAWRSRP